MKEFINSQLRDCRKIIFLSILIICLGVVLMNAISTSSVGIVFVAVGGVFFIIGMAKKKEENKIK